MKLPRFTRTFLETIDIVHRHLQRRRAHLSGTRVSVHKCPLGRWAYNDAAAFESAPIYKARDPMLDFGRKLLCSVISSLCVINMC